MRFGVGISLIGVEKTLEELFWNGFCFFDVDENGFSFSFNVLEDVSGVVSTMDGVGEISEGCEGSNICEYLFENFETQKI